MAYSYILSKLTGSIRKRSAHKKKSFILFSFLYSHHSCTVVTVLWMSHSFVKRQTCAFLRCLEPTRRCGAPETLPIISGGLRRKPAQQKTIPKSPKYNSNARRFGLTALRMGKKARKMMPLTPFCRTFPMPDHHSVGHKQADRQLNDHLFMTLTSALSSSRPDWL